MSLIGLDEGLRRIRTGWRVRFIPDSRIPPHYLIYSHKTEDYYIMNSADNALEMYNILVKKRSRNDSH